MDATLLERLESEHRQVEKIFAQLENAEEESQQRKLVEQLATALSQHMQVEEQQVYPELVRIDGEMEQEAETEHQLGRDGLGKLQELIGQPGFGAAVAMLKAGIEHHVEEEEGEAFPKLRKEFGLAGRTSSKSSGGSGEPTRDELYEEAKKAGIEGRASMTKDELSEALRRS